MQVLKACMCTIFLVSVCSLPSGSAVQDKEDLELIKVLNKIDEVSKSFRSFSAKLTQKKYTAVLEEFDTPETGEFCYAFEKDKSVLMRHEVQSPGKRILTIKGDSAVLYQPTVNQAQIYNLGKRKNLVEYLATGLGQSSAKLKEKFYIAYQGMDSIAGNSCSVLVFNPKDPKVAASVKSITIWFKKSTGNPAQYKIQEPSGDYLLETFREEKLNGKIPDSKFSQKLSNRVEIIRL
jgi:outer membrane lipoprotein-sorting protein